MKSKLIIITIFFLAFQSCELTKEEFNKITPDNFYKTEKDAKLAIASLYENMHVLFQHNRFAIGVIADMSTGDMLRGFDGAWWNKLLDQQWTETNGEHTQTYFGHYKNIQTARKVAKEIEAMDIPTSVKRSLVAEANAMAGWLAYILYDWYGPVPYPNDEMINNPTELNYPSRPSSEEFVEIIEDLFADKDLLMEPDFGNDFGRMNKGMANLILMKLYMLEAARTNNNDFWQKALMLGEEIVSSGWYQLENNYSEVFSITNEKNREIIYARPGDTNFNGHSWHTITLTNNYPEITIAWAVYKLLWSFYDTYQKEDLRLNTIVASYVSKDGVLIDRDNPYDNRHGLGLGPLPMKYDLDPNQQGNIQGHDFIVYRYAEVILSIAEILNELGTNSKVNSPLMQQETKGGDIIQSDGGTTAASFLNAIRVRSGIPPVQNDLSQSQLRDSILMERGHELYAEGARRTDLIRYQRVTNGNGYKIFNPDPNKFLMPIPVDFINEYQGNIAQNPGY